MNSNGRNRNNTFAGDVLIDGDLVVTGTINGGGGGGGVNNPMTEDLNANNFAINNVSQITAGSSTQILMGEINLQNNVIKGVNQIEVNDVYSPTGQILIGSNLDAQNYAIFNISELSAGDEGFIKTGPLDLQDHDIINVNEIKGNTGANVLYISANLEILENLNGHKNLKLILIAGSKYSINRKFLIENHIRKLELNYSAKKNYNNQCLFIHIKKITG